MSPFEALDEARVWRLLELSDLRILSRNVDVDSQKIILVRSAAVLAYAHWEGYYSDCCDILFDFFDHDETLCMSVTPDISVTTMTKEFNRLFSKGNTPESRLEFFKSIRDHSERSFADLDKKMLKPRSNLNFEKLKFSLGLLGLSVSEFEDKRLKLDRELVRGRHNIAHGGTAEYDEGSLEDLTRFVEELMTLTKNKFEDLIASLSRR